MLVAMLLVLGCDDEVDRNPTACGEVGGWLDVPAEVYVDAHPDGGSWEAHNIGASGTGLACEVYCEEGLIGLSLDSYSPGDGPVEVYRDGTQAVMVYSMPGSQPGAVVECVVVASDGDHPVTVYAE